MISTSEGLFRTVANSAPDRTCHAGLGLWISRDAVWSRLCGVLVFAVGLTCGAAAGASTQATAPVLSGCEPDYPPYCIVTPDKRADGFSVELLRAALKAMGREVVFSTGPAWSALKQDLADGRLQALPLVGRTPEREALFDFTVPYLTMHGAIVVREDCTTILAPADLKARQVAVLHYGHRTRLDRPRAAVTRALSVVWRLSSALGAAATVA